MSKKDIKEMEKEIAGTDLFTKYEDVKNMKTEEYFNNNQFSIDAFRKKYALIENPHETYVQSVKRVCDFIASVEETEEMRTYWSKRWFHEIYNDWWHPAGSIMQGAGSGRKVSLANCSTISLGTGRDWEEWDSLEGIIKNTAYSVAKAAAYRQGTGIDFSRIRPEGTSVLNSSNKSTGVIHWMRFVDSIGNYVGQFGRKPALLISLNCKHPDIENFVSVKSDRSKIQNANLSVQCTDDFYKAVKNNEDWELKFEIPEVKKGQKVYVDAGSADIDCKKDDNGWYYISKTDRKYEVIKKTIKAKSLMKLIAKNMHQNAEPGIQNIDIAKKYSNSDYLGDRNYEVFGTNAPVIGSMLVPTDCGIFPIKDLYDKGSANVIYDSFVKSSVVSLDSQNLSRYRKNGEGKRVKSDGEIVSAKFKKFENQRIYEIHLTGGMILKCNDEHKWFTQNGMTSTKDITVGDKIFCSNNGIMDVTNLKVDINSTSYKDGLLCGWFTGDGFYTVIYNAINGENVKFSRKAVGFLWRKDEGVIFDLFKEKYFQLRGKKLEYIRDRGNDLYETRTSAKEIYNYFYNFGYRDDKYHVPQKCFIDYDFCVAFLKGIFSSDGCFSGNRITLTSVDEDLVMKVQQLLLCWFGIQSHIKRSSSRGVLYETKDGQIKTSNFKERFDLTINKRVFIGKFLNTIGFINERKNNSAKEYLTKKSLRDYSNYNFFLVKAVVETNQYEDMYCAIVPEKHSFVVSGCISSNCSEQYLDRNGSCILSSINCEKFSIDATEREKEFAIIGSSINRFLDNVNECEIKYNSYVSHNQRLSIEKLRRTGAGFTNIAGWLFKQNIAYGSKKSAEVMANFTERYAYSLYKSSIELGHEKGSFGLFNRENLEKSPFIKRMMSLGLKFDALRNATLISIAPTGSVSLMFRDLVMSYGIEPAFGLYYWKRTRISGKYEYYFNVPHIVRECFKKANLIVPINSDTIKDDWQGTKGQKVADFIDANKSKIGIDFKCATDISCKEKLEMMADVMKWVDSSISVTYMLPEKSTWEEVYEFIMLSHEKEVKSISVFTDKKMYGIISFVPFKNLAISLKDDGVGIDPQNFDEEELKALNMASGEVILNTQNAPKRPQSLDADIYSITVNKEKFVIVIGKYNGYPYEVFGGKMNGLKLDIDSKHVSGKITKITRGIYSLEFEETIIKDFSKQFTPIEKIFFRSLSLMLRHGIPIEHIVEQLNKSNDDMFSVSAAISRVLKKYIVNGQKVSGVQCPHCNSTMFYFDGCVQCSCGYSACS